MYAVFHKLHQDKADIGLLLALKTTAAEKADTIIADEGKFVIYLNERSTKSSVTPSSLYPNTYYNEEDPLGYLRM